jgi:16S rRNA (guanine966-N2)-methyltransferase
LFIQEFDMFLSGKNKNKLKVQMMRIIAGSAKGTRLKMVPGSHVRPTADRVKESLFSVIGPFFDGGRVLDLFAGTGSLGLEAVSRGMDEGILIDQSEVSLRVVKENAIRCRLEDRIRLMRKDARAALKQFSKQNKQFDLIFLDPPYQEQLLTPVLSILYQQEIVATQGIVVVEHPPSVQLTIQHNILSIFRELSYGDTTLTLLHRKGDISE